LDAVQRKLALSRIRQQGLEPGTAPLSALEGAGDSKCNGIKRLLTSLGDPTGAKLLCGNAY
jgi:hypothetical protein